MHDVELLLDAVTKAQRDGLLTGSAVANLRRWLTEPAYGDGVHQIAELVRRGEWTTLDESFYTVLPFGTGGRRGPRGIGPNRINARTIAESARGLADWVLQQAGREQASIAIAYDTRHASEELARVCAEVIAAAGVTALLYDGFRPTPQLSFTVRHLGASAGIVISASHNPPSDNGFKAYGPDGGQLVPPHDQDVLQAVERTMGGVIPRMRLEEGLRSGRIRWLGASEDEAYLQAVVETSRCAARDAKIVFTPLHGAGIRSVPEVLGRAGFHDLHLVASQTRPNGDFSNVRKNIPNPEEPEALVEAAELAQTLDADIAIGTDPDADRLGCWARTREGTMARLTGNQIGAILCHHVLDTMAEQGTLRPEHLILTTTVTSPMIGKLARHYGAGVIEELLVGFKYVACVLRSLDDPSRVVFACEESHGYLGGPYTRDKDGAGAALLLAEAVARWKGRGLTLWDALDGIYGIVGYHCDTMFPYLSPGRTGMARIERMLKHLRERPPLHIAGLRVHRMTDRWNGSVRDLVSGHTTTLPPISDPLTGAPVASLALARDNLLIFEMEGDGRVHGLRAAVRPSGTEPKCKFYVSAWAAPGIADVDTRVHVDRLADHALEELMAYALSAADET